MRGGGCAFSPGDAEIGWGMAMGSRVVVAGAWMRGVLVPDFIQGFPRPCGSFPSGNFPSTQEHLTTLARIVAATNRNRLLKRTGYRRECVVGVGTYQSNRSNHYHKYGREHHSILCNVLTIAIWPNLLKKVGHLLFSVKGDMDYGQLAAGLPDAQELVRTRQNHG